MIKVYAITLVLGVLGLIVAIFGNALAENVGRPSFDPLNRFGLVGKTIVAAVAGFGMGGMSAEFSPLDFSWQVSLLLALVAAGLSILWVRYAVTRAEG